MTRSDPQRSALRAGPVHHPVHPRHLVGSKWSDLDPSEGARHYEVVAFARRRGTVTLLAVLTGARRELPWRALRDRGRWAPGWV